MLAGQLKEESIEQQWNLGITWRREMKQPRVVMLITDIHGEHPVHVGAAMNHVFTFGSGALLPVQMCVWYASLAHH